MLPKKFFLALDAVAYIALHGSEQPVSAKALMAYLGVHPRYLEPFLQSLSRGGVLRSLRGPKGGYILARERRRISARDILRLVSDEETQGNTDRRRYLKSIRNELDNRINDYLETISMDILVVSMKGEGEVSDNPNFVI